MDNRFFSTLLVFVGSFAGGLAAYAAPLTEELATVHGKANAGDAYYQGALSLFHRHGERGLHVNLPEAEKWARLAAKKDGAFGFCALAGIELEKGNLERGRYLYDEAYLNSGLLALARQNDPLALFCLSMIEMDNPPAMQLGNRVLQIRQEVSGQLSGQ